MNPLKKICALGVFATAFFDAHAQCDPAPPPDSIRIFPNRPITATTQSANVLYIAGNFTVVGTPTGGFTEIDVNTSRPVLSDWPQVRGRVNTVLPDGNGGWYIGGEFEKVGDSMRRDLAQVDANGDVTPWDPLSSTYFSEIQELYINDSILYIGGQIDSFLGDTVSDFVAVNINTGQMAAQQWSVEGRVRTVAVHNNILYLSGTFYKINDSLRDRAAAIDLATGQILPWHPQILTYSYIHDFAFVNNRMFVGGDFTSISGVSRVGLAELDLITGQPTSWVPPVSGSFSNVEWHNGSLYLAGSIQYSGNQARPMLVRTDTSGTPFVDTLATSATGYTNDLVFYGDTIIVAGYLDKVNGNTRKGLFAWDLSGDSLSSWTCFAGVASGEGVIDMHVQNGRLYIAGDFINVGKLRDGLAAIDMNADTLLNWTPVFHSAPFNARYINELLADGNKLYMIGSFDSVNSSARRSAAAVDRFTGQLLPWNPKLSGANTTLGSIALSGNSVYLGGGFLNINNIERKGLAAVDTITGQVTRPWNPHTFASPWTVSFNTMIAHDTSIIVGGSFYDIANVQRHNIVRLGRESGIADAGWHPDIMGSISSMVLDGPYLYVAGGFSWVDSQYCRGIVRLRASEGDIVPWSAAQHFDTNYMMNDAVLSVAGNSIYVGADSLTVFDKGSGNEHFSSILNSPGGSFRNVDHYNGKLYVSGSFYNYVPFYSIPDKPAIHHFTWFNVNDPLPTVSLTGANPVCAGTWVTYGATTSVTNPSYQWQVNGVNATSTSNQLIYQPQQNDVISVVVTDPTPSCFTSSVIAANMDVDAVPANTTPTATITGPGTLCASGYTGYTLATNVQGGTNQWYLNGSPTLANSIFYTPYVQDGDIVQCLVTAPPLSCYTASTAADAINIDTVPTIIPTITIDAGSYTTQGSVVWVDATVTNVTNGYTIRWFIDGVLHADVANSTATSYIKGPGIDTVVAVIIPFGHCIETDTSNIRIINVTGIEEIETKNDITAYPNPCTDQLTLAGLRMNDNITLFDLTGRKMKQWTATQEKQQLPMTDLPTGNYILHIRSSEGEIRTSELIQKK